jgi:uncharacterized delta-60 repeat protein
VFASVAGRSGVDQEIFRAAFHRKETIAQICTHLCKNGCELSYSDVETRVEDLRASMTARQLWLLSTGRHSLEFLTNNVTLSAPKPWAMALQTDGKILVAGTRIVSKAIVGSVARFNSDGSPDSSFGTSGQTNLTSLSLLYSVALQTINSQQYIVAGGGSASTGVFSVARITPVGTLDAAFGSSAGYSTTDFCGAGSTIFSVNVDTAGNILAGGTAALVAGGPPKFGIVRFDHNGLLDTTFGDPSSSGLTRTGRTLLDFYGYKNFLMSLLPVLDANGNQVSYLAAGYAGQSTGQFSQNQYLVLARYHLDGSLDTSFGTNGSGGLAVDFGSANNYVMKPAEHNTFVQPDGRAERMRVITSLSLASGNNRLFSSPHTPSKVSLPPSWGRKCHPCVRYDAAFFLLRPVIPGLRIRGQNVEAVAIGAQYDERFRAAATWLVPRIRLRPISCATSKWNAGFGRRSPRRSPFSNLPISACNAAPTVCCAAARSVHVDAADILRSRCSRCRNSSSVHPTCLQRVCPPRSSSFFKS